MSENTHILFLSSWYPNRNHPTHGIFNRHFAKAAARHHKVSVLHVNSEKGLKHQEIRTGEDPELFELYLYYPKTTWLVPGLSLWLKQKRYLKAIQILFNRISQERGRPDLIHCNVALPAGWAALKLSQKYGIPFVLNEGWTGYMEADGSYSGWLQKWLTRRIISQASRVLPVSEDLKQAMIGQGLTGNYTVIPNVIQTEIFVSGKTAFPEKIRFIHVSSFDPKQKNVTGLIQAFCQALSQKPEMELLLVGDSEYKTELERFAGNMKQPNKLRFLGSKTSGELAELFQTTTALVMFSNYESFGVVIGEALSCGLPVICSRAVGLSSLLTEREAILVEKGNQEELCKAILNMAQNHRQFNRNQLRSFVEERFSEKIISEQLHTVYQSIMDKKHAE